MARIKGITKKVFYYWKYKNKKWNEVWFNRVKEPGEIINMGDKCCSLLEKAEKVYRREKNNEKNKALAA